MLKRIWLALSLAIVAGCASSDSPPKAPALQNLAPNEGYVLLSVSTNIGLASISVNGPKRLFFTKDDLKTNSTYLLVAAPAGDYSFAEVNFVGMYRRDMTDDEVAFSVEAGKINYVGHLSIESIYSDGSAGIVFLSNKGSEGFKFMQEKFPELLKGHSMRYAGQGDDFFFPFIQPLVQGAKP